MKLITDRQYQYRYPVIAQVSYSESSGFGAVGESERRSIPVFSPRGISYRPCEGDNLLMLPVDGMDVCVGVLGNEKIEAGELSLSSSGGASIWLRKNGDVVINGVTITKNGIITPP